MGQVKEGEGAWRPGLDYGLRCPSGGGVEGSGGNANQPPARLHITNFITFANIDLAATFWTASSDGKLA